MQTRIDFGKREAVERPAGDQRADLVCAVARRLQSRPRRSAPQRENSRFGIGCVSRVKWTVRLPSFPQEGGAAADRRARLAVRSKLSSLHTRSRLDNDAASTNVPQRPQKERRHTAKRWCELAFRGSEGCVAGTNGTGCGPHQQRSIGWCERAEPLPLLKGTRLQDEFVPAMCWNVDLGG